MSSQKIKIAIADDHQLFRQGLASLISDDKFTVVFQAENGRMLTDFLKEEQGIQVVLMDIHMPEMNGFEATDWIRINCPAISVIALTMSDVDMDVIKMIRCGAKGYLLKDTEIATLKKAIRTVLEKGSYHTEHTYNKLLESINNETEQARAQKIISTFTSQELTYIIHACSELSHKEIALLMELSPRTIDGYRDNIFNKTGLSTRVGLVLFAIRHGLFSI